MSLTLKKSSISVHSHWSSKDLKNKENAQYSAILPSNRIYKLEKLCASRSFVDKEIEFVLQDLLWKIQFKLPFHPVAVKCSRWDVISCVQSAERAAPICAHLEINAAKCYTRQISCWRKSLYFPLQLWLLLAGSLFLRRILATMWKVSLADVWTPDCDKWARNAVIHR